MEDKASQNSDQLFEINFNTTLGERERERERKYEKDSEEEEDGKDRERRISVRTMLEERTRQGEQEANLQKYKKIKLSAQISFFSRYNPKNLLIHFSGASDTGWRSGTKNSSHSGRNGTKLTTTNTMLRVKFGLLVAQRHRVHNPLPISFTP